MDYGEFLKNKLIKFNSAGFEYERELLNKNAFEWQKKRYIAGYILTDLHMQTMIRRRNLWHLKP